MQLIYRQRTSLSLGDISFAVLILLLVILYDWRMMAYTEVQFLVNVLKFFIAFWLVFYVLFKRVILPTFKPIRYYFLFFFLFLLSALVSSTVADDSIISFMQWIKLLSRCIIGVGLLLVLVRWPTVKIAVVRIFVYLAALVIIQYVILFVLYTWGVVEPQFNFHGMLSILGTGIPTSLGLLRLTSFWYEPSKAAGFLFPVVFLAAWLYSREKKFRWKLITIFSFVAGFLCFANAGYFAIGAGIIVWSWYIWRHRLSRYSGFYAIILMIGIFILLAGVFGKLWVVMHAENNNSYVNTIFGIRGTNLYTINGISEGRTQLAQENFNTVLQQNPLFGIGLQIPGKNSDGTAVDTSATAPILWLMYTGFAGLFFLLLTIWQVARCYFSKYMQKSTLYFYCAWIVSLMQQLVYGDWIDPFFLFLSCLVFIDIYQYRQELKFSSKDYSER